MEAKETYNGTENDINAGDEQHCDGQSFPEIQWVAHFSEEGDEKKSTTIRVNQVINTVQDCIETVGRFLILIWDFANKCHNGLNRVDKR